MRGQLPSRSKKSSNSTGHEFAEDDCDRPAEQCPSSGLQATFEEASNVGWNSETNDGDSWGQADTQDNGWGSSTTHTEDRFGAPERFGETGKTDFLDSRNQGDETSNYGGSDGRDGGYGQRDRGGSGYNNRGSGYNNRGSDYNNRGSGYGGRSGGENYDSRDGGGGSSYGNRGGGGGGGGGSYGSRGGVGGAGGSPSYGGSYGGDAGRFDGRHADGRTCDLCGQSGHIARNCFRNAANKQNMERCSNCEGKGHTAERCPSERFDSQGSSSRFGNNSTSGYSSGADGPRQANQATCHRCHETGHYAHACQKRVGANADDDAEASRPYQHVVQTTEQDTTNRNNTGINFSRYDEIQVKVSNSTGKEIREFENKKLNTFREGNLCDDLLTMLAKLKFSKPTPVQRYAIPILAEGYDIMACAQTGSGKTAAFILPIVNTLISSQLQVDCGRRPQRPYALILTPTRELAVQITKDAQAYCFRTRIFVKECYGGTHIGTQIRNIEKGCHLLVGTTGRVKDFLNREVVSLSNLRYLVLDEADRMLDMGFSHDIQEIMQHHKRVANNEVQTLMFSATFPKQVQALAREYLRGDFVKLDVGVVGAVNADVAQYVEQIVGAAKKTRLIRLVQDELKTDRNAKILVFVETKRTADFVASFLSSMDIKATSMHGDRLQQQRETALAHFQCGDCPVLVATSVAARGLDITGVSHVVNYDLPKEIDDYVHRVGRTGRVGNKGRATSFFDPNKDFGIQNDLRQSLIDGGENPPDFLLGHGYSTGGDF